MEVVNVRGLFKKYGKIVALKGLSFDVGREIVGLVGPNGAGKTTTIRILLGLTKADKGEVRVLGFDPWREGHLMRKHVGVLHEKPIYPPWLTGISLLERVARLRFLRNPRNAALNALRKFGLADAATRKIEGYSAGMIQRLGLAQAFLGDPEIVMLDEPTANLDPLARSFVINMISELQKEKSNSIIISTHILSELEKVCSRVVFIKEGSVVESGSLTSLKKKYFRASYKLRTSDDGKIYRVLSNINGIEVNKGENGLIIHVKNFEGDFSKELVRIVHDLRVSVFLISEVEPTLDELYLKVMS